MSKYLTPKENLALDLAMEYLGESRINRTPQEYADIIARLPPVKVLHGYVNDVLRQRAKANYAPYRICYFKPGDRHHWLEEFPQSLSIEVVRSALVKSGFRQQRSPRRS
jgi:hypothetical protein